MPAFAFQIIEVKYIINVSSSNSFEVKTTCICVSSSGGEWGGSPPGPPGHPCAFKMVFVVVVVVVALVELERVGSCEWIWVYQKPLWGAIV